MRDDAYTPYCKTCGGKIHRGRGDSWVHYKADAGAGVDAPADVAAAIQEFILRGREARFFRDVVAFLSVPHKAEPIWTSAEGP